MSQFIELGLRPSIAKTVGALGFETPTPIQQKAIPLVLEGRDVMGLAQTGTGKTGAFGLPLVHQLMEKHSGRPEEKTVRALVLAPTRELVNQIADNLRNFVKGTPLRVNIVVGGAGIIGQVKTLARGTDILVATPGRLIDLLDRRAVRLDAASFLVLDEADQMLDMGFIHALRRIAPLVGKPRQTLLFSATMPKQMAELSRAYLDDPVRVEAARPGLAADKVRQTLHQVPQNEKLALLKVLLAQNPDDLSLVFSRTKHGAERTMKRLTAAGFSAASIHGNKSQAQREKAIGAFRKGFVRVLVATDVAARGIDIPGVTHVYNYDLPEVPENYVHRIGRTARAGADGEAIAFCAPDERKLLRDVERVLKTKIPVVQITDEMVAAMATATEAAAVAQANGEGVQDDDRDLDERPRGGRGGYQGRRNESRGGEGRDGERRHNRGPRVPREDRTAGGAGERPHGGENREKTGGAVSTYGRKNGDAGERSPRKERDASKPRTEQKPRRNETRTDTRDGPRREDRPERSPRRPQEARAQGPRGADGRKGSGDEPRRNAKPPRQTNDNTKPARKPSVADVVAEVREGGGQQRTERSGSGNRKTEHAGHANADAPLKRRSNVKRRRSSQAA